MSEERLADYDRRIRALEDVLQKLDQGIREREEMLASRVRNISDRLGSVEAWRTTMELVINETVQRLNAYGPQLQAALDRLATMDGRTQYQVVHAVPEEDAANLLLGALVRRMPPGWELGHGPDGWQCGPDYGLERPYAFPEAALRAALGEEGRDGE